MRATRIRRRRAGWGRGAAAGALALALAAVAGAQLESETEIADVLEIVVLERAVLAIDARGGGETRERLELGEQVIWTGSRGLVGVALTDRRVLAVRAESAAWQEASYRLGEVPPPQALLGDRVALVVTSRRVLGFDGGSGNLVEHDLGPREAVQGQGAGENVAVVVTDREALGLSPVRGGFFPATLHLNEQVVSLSVRANVATLRTSDRLLIFRANTGTWEERRLNLEDQR